MANRFVSVRTLRQLILVGIPVFAAACSSGGGAGAPSSGSSGGAGPTTGGSSGRAPAGGAGGGGQTGSASGDQGGAGGAPGGTTALSFSVNAVVRANGRYVAAGNVIGSATDAIILTSDDGKAWFVSYYGRDQAFTSVAANGERWVAAGARIEQTGADSVHHSFLVVSEDATTWRAVVAPESTVLGVIWTGTEFLMKGEGDREERLFSSPNGLTWTTRFTGQVPSSLTVGSPGLVGSYSSMMALSGDRGATWTYSALEEEAEVLGLWPDGDGFGGAAYYRCCFGELPDSDLYYALHSSDGRVWQQQRADNPPKAVAHIGDIWVGMSARYGFLLYRDAATLMWIAVPNLDTAGGFALAAGERFVAATGNGIWTSEDGKTWTAATLPTELPAAQ